jgi:hypothetical protein
MNPTVLSNGFCFGEGARRFEELLAGPSFPC